VKNLYEILGVDAAAPEDEIKRAFRREIARYHPDKVVHLGEEFQQLASVRAAALTEAYRILTNPDERAAYDEQLKGVVPDRPAAAPPSARPRQAQATPEPVSSRPPDPETPPREASVPPLSERDRYQRMVLDDYVRKEALKRLKNAILTVFDQADEYQGLSFDIALLVRPKRGLIKFLDRPLLLCSRWVPKVDVAAIQDAWVRAIRLAHISRRICLVLVGNEVIPKVLLARELEELRSRLARLDTGTAINVVAIDAHNWKAAVPDDTSHVVRMILDKLPKQ
jgi:curved DNA-binding protein CbpA